MLPLEKVFMFSVAMPQRAAVVSGEGALTWQELYLKSQTCIQYIYQRFHGGTPRRACIVSPNRVDLIPWMAALSSLGVPAIGLDYSLPSQTIQQYIFELKVDIVLFSGTNFPNNFENTAFESHSVACIDLDKTSSWIGTDIERVINLEKLIASRPEFRSIGLTSGTSGNPKVVVRTRSFDQQRFKFFTEKYDFGAHDRFLVSLPLYHAAGNGWARMFMSLGATIYLASSASPVALTDTLTRQKITATVMTPPLLDGVLDRLDESVDDHAKLDLRWLLIGGKHFAAPQKIRALKRLGMVVHEYYGTTETGVNTIAQPEDLLRTPTSVGRIFEGNSIAIINPEGNELAPYEIGAVAVASYMNMDHYGDGSSNSVQLGGKRFLITPDQGYLDVEGRLYLTNRAANAADETPIYLLEDEIRMLPCVRDVALLPRAGAALDCAIVLRKTTVDVQHVLNSVRELISHRQLSLGDCRLLSAIPYSLTGKIRTSELQSIFSTQ